MVMLLLSEWILRVIAPRYNPNKQTPFRLSEEGLVLGFPSQTFHPSTPKGDWSITVRFNQHGLRDHNDFQQSTSNALFVAGDSFPFGWGVEEEQRFSNVLEKQLGLPIYNVCAPEDIKGYGATLKYVERHGGKIRNLIACLSMETDVWDYTRAESTHAQYAKQMKGGKLRAALNWFRSHSALWLWTSHTIQQTKSGRELFEKVGIAKNVDALTHKNDYSLKSLTATRDEWLKLVTNYHSITLIAPTRALWYGQNKEQEAKVHGELVALLRESGLAVIDMRPVFEKTGNPLQFYFQNDSHWNATGHKAAAGELVRYLNEQKDWQPLVRQQPGP